MVMNPDRLESLEKSTDTMEELDNPWQTVLFNDEVHSFDEVILQIQKATGYSLERSYDLTMRVHKSGKAVVYIGDKTACEKVSNVLKQIQLIVQVEKT